jgi:hypothetical protein
LQLLSCTYYRFDQPLPVDAKNVYTFPKSFQGEWFQMERGQKLLALVIRRDYFEIIGKEIKMYKVYKGVIDSIAFKSGKKAFRHSHFDHDMNRLDTINDFVIRDNKIYKATEGKLTLLGTFKDAGDSALVMPMEKARFDLGENYFLRKVNKDLYILNLKEGNLLSDLSDGFRPNWLFAFAIKLDHRGLLIGEPHEFPDSTLIYKFKPHGGGFPDLSDKYYYVHAPYTSSLIKESVTRLFSFEDLRVFRKDSKELDSLIAVGAQEINLK